MSAQTVLHASARAHGSAGPPGPGPEVPVPDHLPGPASRRALDGGTRRVGPRNTAPAPVPCHPCHPCHPGHGD